MQPAETKRCHIFALEGSRYRPAVSLSKSSCKPWRILQQYGRSSMLAQNSQGRDSKGLGFRGCESTFRELHRRDLALVPDGHVEVALQVSASSWSSSAACHQGMCTARGRLQPVPDCVWAHARHI